MPLFLFLYAGIDAVVEGRSALPVYASAYALQGGLTGRSGKTGRSASNAESFEEVIHK